ncbi:hypothetical protein J7382_08940 [Shimia sp. R11_0]|uniref:hypothetical protein n=1 Tax=Shimia sp. R11_0 TaxID=2821096 RepID=UPI001ADCC273|nr:hypothetical protein [Shimia sp. R11_0]MBO9477656.1 hypothetical protein [Shimia sp. R11_0]
MSFADLIAQFDHVYIVNLPYRLDRRRETIAEFARHGLAIPSAKVSFFEATRPNAKGAFPSIGALGNFRSQTRVLADAVSQGHRRILICEDDLQLNTVPSPQLTRLIDDLTQTPWDIAALGYLDPQTPPGVAKDSAQGLMPWSGSTRGTQLWAIQGDCIRAFHDYLETVRRRPPGHPDGGSMFFDGAFNLMRRKLPDVTFRIAAQSLAGQRASRTDIHSLAFFDRLEPFRSLSATLRRLRNHARA